MSLLSKNCRFLSIAAFVLLAAGSSFAQVPKVTLETLLDEQTDRCALTKVPNYVCKQASSYDRAAKSPEENWFANADASQFIREEQNGDRKESVLMEAEGPGAVVRWWITAPHYKNNFYVYIDGEETPAISGNIADVVGGEALVGAPLSAERSRGRDLYLPIPYAKSIKITCDNMEEQGNLYYQVDYRTYPQDVEVESFSTDALTKYQDKIAATQKLLLEPNQTRNPKSETQGFKRRLVAEEIEGSYENHSIKGPGAITEIDVKLTAEDVPAATRNIVLAISFDDEETVWVPVGEFFGSGVGVNPNKTWFTEVLPDGTMKAYWRMPFAQVAKVSFLDFGKQDVVLDYAVYYEKAPFTEDTMYFHANWRQERAIQTIAGNGTKDWNYTTLKGTGVYVGDVLSVVNPTSAWWGEGDEKIYVDGEKFPSHFGTGTEDYYGYAWCTPEFFEAPFHAQPRCEGPGNFGNTTNLRLRSLDAIPFRTDFRFDMEVWHWEAALVNYAVATFWYGLKGTSIVEGVGPNREELEDEAEAPVSYKSKFTFKFDDFDATEVSGGRISVQDMKGFENENNAWKNSKQLWWTEGKPGDFLTLNVKNVELGKTKLYVGAAVARDYGKANFCWNGEKIGESVDFFHSPEVEKRVVAFDVPETTETEGVLTVELVGKNDESIGTMIGIDSIQWGDKVEGEGDAVRSDEDESKSEETSSTSNVGEDCGAVAQTTGLKRLNRVRLLGAKRSPQLFRTRPRLF